jgi:hypothetical protein
MRDGLVKDENRSGQLVRSRVSRAEQARDEYCRCAQQKAHEQFFPAIFRK